MFYIAYIKKDVNKVLLLFIVVLLVLLTYSSTYYEFKLRNITNDYNNQLNRFTGNVVYSNESLALKESFQKDKEALEKGYFELKDENERLKSEADSAKTKLSEQVEKFNKLHSHFNQVQDALIRANNDISSLIARNKELCRKLKEKGEEC